MSKHTPEPWSVSPLGMHIHVGSIEICRMFDDSGEDCENHEANARRIVACVNACAGIPTEALEDGSARAERDTLREMTGGTFYEIKKQRDELLAELEHAASYHASHECYAEANRVRKFIASVKEQGK